MRNHSHKPNWRRQKLISGVPSFEYEGLYYDGEKLQCALCGNWYIGLSHHIAHFHTITPDEYRAKYSLNRIQPLCTPQYSDSHIKCIERLENPNREINSQQKHTQKVRTQGRSNIALGASTRQYTQTPKIPNTPLRLIALKANLAKASCSLISTQPCCYCGKETTGRRSHGKICCPECRPKRSILWYYKDNSKCAVI